MNLQDQKPLNTMPILSLFGSIFEREVIYREEFFSIEHLNETAHKFITFYNDERLHAGLRYRSPEMVLKDFLIC